jgi:histidinol phosphatase-like enzyme
LFLDRDGVVVEEVHFLQRTRDVRLPGDVATAIAEANAARIAVIVVTNQSGMARGFSGRPLNVDHPWREPATGMFETHNLLSLDLSRSLIVGDRISDIEVGRNAASKAAFWCCPGRLKAEAFLIPYKDSRSILRSGFRIPTNRRDEHFACSVCLSKLPLRPVSRQRQPRREGELPNQFPCW